mgnify:CR=1 FL=1
MSRHVRREARRGFLRALYETIAAGSNVLRDYASHCTAMNVRFTLKLFPGVRPLVEGKFAEMFKLISAKTITTSNMHLHAAEGSPQGRLRGRARGQRRALRDRVG